MEERVQCSQPLITVDSLCCPGRSEQLPMQELVWTLIRQKRNCLLKKVWGFFVLFLLLLQWNLSLSIAKLDRAPRRGAGGVCTWDILVHIHGVKQAVHVNLNRCPHLSISSMWSGAFPAQNLLEGLTFFTAEWTRGISVSPRTKGSHCQFLHLMALCLMPCVSGILGIAPNPGFSPVRTLVCKKVQTQLSCSCS